MKYYYVSSKLYKELEKTGKLNMKRYRIASYLDRIYCGMCAAKARDMCICEKDKK